MQPRPLECTGPPDCPRQNPARSQLPSTQELVQLLEPPGVQTALGLGMRLQVSAVVFGLACSNGVSPLDTRGDLGLTGASPQPQSRCGLPAGPGGAPCRPDAPECACYCFEGDVLDLLAETPQYVTRVTLNIPKWMLIWKPLPQTLICRVKVSIWKRGFFFFFSLHESLSRAWRDGPAALICELHVLNAY